MRASRAVVKNTILLAGGLLAGRLLAVFLRKKMTPILDTDGFGVLYTAIGLVQIMQTVARFGLGVLLTREIARRRELTATLFWSTMRIRFGIALISYAALAVFVVASGYASIERTAVLLLALGLFIESTGMACDSVLQAHEKVEYQTAGQLASAVAYFGLGWWWLEGGYGLLGVVWANVISQAVRLGVMLPFMFRHTGPWLSRAQTAHLPDVPSTRQLMTMAFPLFLSTTFGVIYTKIDTVMLKGMVSNDAAGIYGLGHQALDLTMMLPGLFGTALFPAMARYGRTSPADAARLGERSLRLMMVAIMPLTLFLTLVAVPVIGWFDENHTFVASAPVMQMLIWGLPFQAAAVVLNRLLITADREKVFVQIGLTAMVLNIILNVLLIPRFTYYGASVATIASLVVSLWMHVVYLRGTSFLPPLKRALGGPLVALVAAWAATVAMVGLLLPGWGISWKQLPLTSWPAFLGATAIMTVLYPAALVGFKVLRRDDAELVAGLHKRDTSGD